MTTSNSISPKVENNTKLTRGLLFLMALASGIGVANIYFLQPIIADMAQAFQVSASEIGSIGMLTQIGYALGLFLFVPLGDLYEKKRLILILLVAVTLALVAVALSQNLLMLGIASFIMGITTVIPQIIVPFVAQLAESQNRGKAIGTVMSGLFMGILLARTFSGILGNLFGWRSIYWVAAVLMLLLALVLKKFLPLSPPTLSNFNYMRLLKSLGQLFVELPILRRTSLYGAMTFGAFSAFWSSLAFFLKEPPYQFNSTIIGLFGLFGIVGTLFAPVAGRLADKKTPRFVGGFSGILILISLFIIWKLGTSVGGLILGIIILDLGVRSSQISNQTQIFNIIPEARNRLNTIYMVSYFIGGAVGSYLGPLAWSILRWDGVFFVGILMTMVGMLTFLPTLNKKEVMTNL